MKSLQMDSLVTLLRSNAKLTQKFQKQEEDYKTSINIVP